MVDQVERQVGGQVDSSQVGRQVGRLVGRQVGRQNRIYIAIFELPEGRLQKLVQQIKDKQEKFGNNKYKSFFSLTHKLHNFYTRI